MSDPIPELMNLQLLALADISRKLQGNSDRLIRVENRLESMAQNLDRLNHKGIK